MKITDLFTTKDPECLFCRSLARQQLTSVSYFESPIYECQGCLEQVSAINDHLLYFTCLGLEVYLDFEKNKIHLSFRNRNVTKINWISFNNFNKLSFDNRYKLHKKLKSYIIFS